MGHQSAYENEDEQTRRSRLLKEAQSIEKEASHAGLDSKFVYKLYQVAENPEANDVPITDDEIERIWKLSERCNLTHKESIGSICQRVYRNYKANPTSR